jgi:DNA-binding FrmR family transcriptional regulator
MNKTDSPDSLESIAPNKVKALKCANQAQGTLNKVSQMILDDRYCPEIIQQVDSVIGLLKTARRELLAGHLDTCVAHQMAEDKQKAIAELLKIYNLTT